MLVFESCCTATGRERLGRPVPGSCPARKVFIGVAELARGCTDKLILPGDGERCPDFERALKMPRHVKEVLNEGKGKFAVSSVGPGPVLRAGEWAVAVRAYERAAV